MAAIGCHGAVAGGTDKYDALKAMTWQVHVSGSVPPELRGWCGRCNLPLHVFAWRQEYVKAASRRTPST